MASLVHNDDLSSMYSSQVRRSKDFRMYPAVTVKLLMMRPLDYESIGHYHKLNVPTIATNVWMISDVAAASNPSKKVLHVLSYIITLS